MPLSPRFFSVAGSIFHPGMGTENAGPLLYSLTCMRRPNTVIAVGLGYSTLFVLQALADVCRERDRDAQVLSGRIDDPARREVLLATPEPATAGETTRLIGIDDFSDDGGRLTRLNDCAQQLEVDHLFELHRMPYQDWCAPDGLRADMVWLDCGHQMDYADLCNRFWPLVNDDGGLLAMHYTYVDVQVVEGEPPVVIPGAWANAVKRQLGHRGISAGFEMLSLVEPHKYRQGSVTLLRKVGDDLCRDNPLAQEQFALYGRHGDDLVDLNGGAAETTARNADSLEVG